LPILPGDVVNNYAHVTAQINQCYFIAQIGILSHVIAEFPMCNLILIKFKVNPVVLCIIHIYCYLPGLKIVESTEWGRGQDCRQPPPNTIQNGLGVLTYCKKRNKKEIRWSEVYYKSHTQLVICVIQPTCSALRGKPSPVIKSLKSMMKGSNR